MRDGLIRSISRTNTGSTGKLIKGPFVDLNELKEVVLRLKTPSTWSSDAGLSPSTVRILDCKSTTADSKGFSQLVEINTPDGRLNEVVTKIKKNPEVIEARFSKTKRGGAIGRILSRHTLACRNLQKSSLFCRTCLFHAKVDDAGETEWTLVLPDGSALDEFINRLESDKIKVEIKNISRIVDGRSLTSRQQSIIHYALDKGYFDYPRKADLSTLAKELGISKSNLSEILRRGAKKALNSHLH